MKGFFKFIGVVFTIVSIIYDVVEFLIIPAILVVIGILNTFPWQYYIISIGIYILFFALIEITSYFIFKAFEKVYVPVIVRKLEKYFNKFSKE